MPKSVSFVPDAHSGARSQDLTYVERISRNRSLHLLLQDTSSGSHPSASRQQFLSRSFREIISRYLSLGRIEHPVVVARELIHFLESLSRQVDTRVDDSRGLGIYILLQDGNTFYLLTMRDAGAQMRRSGVEWRTIDARTPGVREVPVESRQAQQELFTRSVRGSLVFYRVDPGPGGTDTQFLLGGTADEAAVVADVIDDPGVIDRTADGTPIALGLLSRTLAWCRFEPVVAERLSVAPAKKTGRRAPSGRDVRIVSAAAAALVVCAGAVLVSQHYGLGASGTPTLTRGDRTAGEQRAVSLQESPSRLRERTAEDPTASDTYALMPDAVSDVGDARATALQMELTWSRELTDAVTTTPVIAGDIVVFGARDGIVYAHDRESGEERWTYRAVDGVGSSPVVAGSAVIGADYAGNVFSLDRKNGTPLWTHRLPAKVVSTPCAAGGEVLVGCLDGAAYGLSLETGRVLWKVETGARVRASAATLAGRFYVPSYDGNLYAVSSGSGSVVWKYAVGGQIASSPAAAPGVIVVGSELGGIQAVDAGSGKRRWAFETKVPVKSFVAIRGERVFVGANDGAVYCLDVNNGAEAWRFMTGGAVLSKPLVLDRYVFVTSYDRFLHCLDIETGYELARYETDASIYSSPVSDGDRIYFGNNAGRFFCVRYEEDSTL